MLARQPLDLAEFHAILGDIVADNTCAGDVISRLRALLRRGGTQLEPLEIGAVVADVLALTRGQLAAQQIGIRTQFAASLPLVLGDRVQLQQVLLDLSLNASEAMSANTPRDRRLIVSTALSDEGLVVVAIADNGTRIEPAAAGRLFEPFFTTKENGLGLGLSICQSIVAAHGGRLEASDSHQRGATFTLTLRCAVQAMEMPESVARVRAG